MKQKQLSNTGRVILALFSIVLLTIVSAKADMIEARYSQYKCTITIPSTPVNKKQEYTKIIDHMDIINDLSMRKFYFKDKDKEPVKTKSLGVRLYDGTHKGNKLVLVTTFDNCEYPAYKII